MRDGQRTAILLVEDDKSIALFEKAILEKNGFAVTVAVSGEEALSLVDGGPAFDLILMDIDLGVGIDGIETASRIMKTKPRPIVFVSSHTDTATMRRIEDVGAYGYVVKDSGSAVLLASVRMALRCSEPVSDAETLISPDRENELLHRIYEKDTLLREVHHRVKNNLTSLESILYLQLDTIDNPEAVSALQSALGRIESMGTLYESLLLEEGYAKVAVKNYVGNLIDSMRPLFPNASAVAIDTSVDDFFLDSKRLLSFGIIINELLTNAMKYAFIGKGSGSIRIEMKLSDDMVTLSVRDDGNGLPLGFDYRHTKGLGLALVGMLCEQLGGEFAMSSDEGTRSVISARYSQKAS